MKIKTPLLTDKAERLHNDFFGELTELTFADPTEFDDIKLQFDILLIDELKETSYSVVNEDIMTIAIQVIVENRNLKLPKIQTEPFKKHKKRKGIFSFFKKKFLTKKFINNAKDLLILTLPLFIIVHIINPFHILLTLTIVIAHILLLNKKMKTIYYILGALSLTLWIAIIMFQFLFLIIT